MGVIGGQVCVCIMMQLANVLEFKAVAVMACDDEVIPLQARIALGRRCPSQGPLRIIQGPAFAARYPE